MDVELAVASEDPDHPIAKALAEAVRAYGDIMARQVERAGGFPDVLTLPEPANAVEAYALELFSAELEAVGLTVRLVDAVVH